MGRSCGRGRQKNLGTTGGSQQKSWKKDFTPRSQRPRSRKQGFDPLRYFAIFVLNKISNDRIGHGLGADGFSTEGNVSGAGAARHGFFHGGFNAQGGLVEAQADT